MRTASCRYLVRSETLLPAGEGCRVSTGFDHSCISARSGDGIFTAVSVDGSVVSGGNVIGNGGVVSGDVIAGGTVTLTGVTVTGTVQEGIPYAPTVDVADAASFFLSRSAYYAGFPSTGSPVVGGQVVFHAVPGTNVFEVDAADLASAWGVAIHGNADATVIINVSGGAGDLTTMDWQVDMEVDPQKVLVNFHEATTLEIYGVQVVGNVLAPGAATSFPAGLVVGGLWVGDLQGGGQVNHGGFIEPEEPSSTEFRSWGSVKSLFR